jgi:acyl-CoA thioester hydrolase
MKQSPKKIANLTPYRVIYGDTDQMGVVYYANYLRWFERGRAEFLRQIGLPYSAIEQHGFHFPVTEVNCRYTRSAHYDDLVTIETELVTVGRATLTFNYRIRRETDDLVLATGSTKHACINGQGKLTRIPKPLEDAIAAASSAAQISAQSIAPR